MYTYGILIVYLPILIPISIPIRIALIQSMYTSSLVIIQLAYIPIIIVVFFNINRSFKFKSFILVNISLFIFI